MKASPGVKYSEFVRRNKMSKAVGMNVVSDGSRVERVEHKLSLKDYDTLTKQQKSRGLQQIEQMRASMTSLSQLNTQATHRPLTELKQTTQAL